MAAPSYYHSLRPNHHRRAVWHDYCEPASYLLTFSKNPSIPRFSEVVGVDYGHYVSAKVEVSEVGAAVCMGMKQFAADYPQIKLRSYVIMPDHVHLIVHVPERLERPLGFYMSKMMGRVTRCVNALDVIDSKGHDTAGSQDAPGNHDTAGSQDAPRNHDTAGNDGTAVYRDGKSLADTVDGNGARTRDNIPAFEAGFNDRILFGQRTWAVWENYVEDNPRRYWLMRKRKNYFERGYVQLKSGRLFPTFGNALLLDYPDKAVVRFSRKLSETEWLSRVDAAMRTAINGGVAVSPFIHPKEKLLRDMILEAGGRVIHIVEKAFGYRGKPAQSDFDLCAQGRLLIISRTEDTGRGDKMTREVAMKLNKMAEWVIAARGLCGLHRN